MDMQWTYCGRERNFDDDTTRILRQGSASVTTNPVIIKVEGNYVSKKK